MKPLVANQNVWAALHHLTGAATVLIAIAESMGFEIVEEYRLAPLNGFPCIGTATFRVNALVRNPERRLVIHDNVSRSGRRRANAVVRATRPVMRIHRHMRLIAESRLGAHYQKNITHNFTFRDTKWQ